ncbi:MAG TPA: phospholipase D family protein [Rhodanobacteraceae bacterium]
MPLTRAAILVAVLAVLSGCALSRQQIRHANRIAATAQQAHAHATCTRADHCAKPSLLLDQARTAMAKSRPGHPVHFVTLLDHGETALAARLNLIHGARHSIDLQTYIWADDDVGNLMLNALVDAARRGVKVDVLADQLFSFQNLEQLATLARTSPNFKLRLYNPTFDDAETSPLQFGASIFCCFNRFNQRMHNKLLLVDNLAGIAGGRNYEDRYFGWGKTFNFRDRDVLVAGPAAREMADSFKLFWNHPRSVPLTHLDDVNRQLVADGPGAPGWQAPHFADPLRVAQVREQASDPAWIKRHITSRSLKVADLNYFSDQPAKTDEPHRKKAHELTLHIMRMIAGARHQIVLQTPYLLLSHRARHIFKLLHHGSHPPRVIVSTNSLASTDAFFSYARTYKHMKRLIKDYGFEIYELKPHPADAGISIAPPPFMDVPQVSGNRPERRPADRYMLRHGRRVQPAPLKTQGIRIGLHAKSIVVDDHFAMVGSHNFDPRSDHYNTESGVIVDDPRFATELRSSILEDTQPKNAWTIAPRVQDIPVISDINRAISTVSEHLPWFDLWPFRYATAYELKPGCAPLAPADPGFYQCYEAVGDFPGVDLPFKSIYTRLVTAFGFGLSSIL